MGDRTTVEGWTAAHTARRVALERKIAALVQVPPVPWIGTRIRCELDITIYWRAPSGAVRLPITGEIVGIEGAYLRLALPRSNEVADRWTRRFLIDALRCRTQWKPHARATLA
jgi:hypothetical protein